MKPNETVELDLEVVAVTRLAIIVDDGDREASLAKSLLRDLNDVDIDDIERGDTLTLTLPEWLAIKEELI